MLFLGGDLLVRSSVSLALRMQISTLVVGMTVVSFVTSAPELFVSIQSALSGITDITFGNVIGSNIANITLVLGLTSIVFRINISSRTKNLYFPFMLIITFLFGFILYFFNEINSISGFFLVSLLLFFTIFLVRDSRKESLNNLDKQSLSKISIYKTFLFMVVGILLLSFGANFLIDGTVLIAKEFGFTERVISVSLVAFGTSIPELSTALVAALKKEESLAVGNLIGSNIFNILAVLGITSIIQPISLSQFNNLAVTFLYHPLFTDFVWMLFATIILGIFIYFKSKNIISRIEGVILFSLYLIFTYTLF